MTINAGGLIKAETECPLTDDGTKALTTSFDASAGFLSNVFQSHRHGSLSLYVDYTLGTATSIELLIQESPREVKFRDITVVKPSDANGVSLVRTHVLSIDASTSLQVSSGSIEIKVEAREGYFIRVLAKATGSLTTAPTLVLSASGGA